MVHYPDPSPNDPDWRGCLIPLLLAAILLLLTLIRGAAQPHTVYGGAGIRFPAALSYQGSVNWNGQLENAAMLPWSEWWTNSQELYHGNNYITTLAGDPSTSQSLILQLGDSIYIFVQDDYDQTQQAWYYVLHQGAIVRTVLLGSPYAEKVTAHQQCHPERYYILHQRCNGTYEIRLLDSTGVHLVSTYATPESMGLCIGCAVMTDSLILSTNYTTGSGGNAHLYRWSSGTITQHLAQWAIPSAYGVALTPDGQHGYVSERTFAGRIHHLQISTYTATPIYTVGASQQPGQMVYGSGHIYAVRYPTASLIKITPPGTTTLWPLSRAAYGLGISQTYEQCPHLLPVSD